MPCTELSKISHDFSLANTLTEPQNHLYNALIEIFIETQMMPTINELAKARGCTPNNIQLLIGKLVDKGYLVKSKNSARSLRFTKLKIKLVAA